MKNVAMTLQSALKGSAIGFAVWSVLFGLSDKLGFRIVEAVGWVLGWLWCWAGCSFRWSFKQSRRDNEKHS